MANEKRLVDVNDLIKKIDDYYHNSPFPHPGTTWLRGLELAVGLMLNAPTVDAVEVVRCKDCKHFNMQRMECENDYVSTDNEGGADYSINFGPDDFCSYGERRTDET